MSPVQHPPTQLPQVDLPPISVGRYLDLVRRRRWQVIPVSILGLIVGALVAFLIPRYYVASTSVVYRGNPTDAAVLTSEDPVADIVASAEVFIPECVPEAIEKLGWEEGRGDLAAVMAFEGSVRDRLNVLDVKKERGRKLANIVIEYSDVDGQRSADLCNMVRDIWIQRERDRIADQVGKLVKHLNEKLMAATRQATAARGDLTSFEIQHKVDSYEVRTDSGAWESRISKNLAALSLQLIELEGREAAVAADLARQNQRLVAIQRYLPPALTETLDDSIKLEYARLQMRIANAKKMVADLTEANPEYRIWHLDLQRAEVELQELYVRAGIGSASTAPDVPNKEWDRLRNEADRNEDELVRLGKQRAALQANLAKLQAERDALPEIQRLWDAKMAALERAEEARDAVLAQIEEADRKYFWATKNDPIENARDAQVQAAPSDPNIYLVALAGSLVGLGAVIVLILLVDMLQSTFKTVGDVEHALALPVLGTMAHMESEEIRDEASRVRLRKTVFAGIGVALIIAMIVVYYVDPTRLPEPVRQLLSLILDEPGRGR